MQKALDLASSANDEALAVDLCGALKGPNLRLYHSTDVRGVEIGHAFVERTTFVVTKDGKIAEAISGAAPDKNVEQALAAVQRLTAKAK